MQPGWARTSSLGVPLLPLARWVGWVAPVCPTHGVLVLSCPPAALRVCGVLGLPAPVHRCARSVCCVGCAVSWASRLLFSGLPARCVVLRVRCPGPSWLLITGVPARCVVLRVRCPGPPGSCSPMRPLGVLCCVCGVLALLAPVHRCARSVCCVGCAVSWASWLLFTGVPAQCVVLRVRCPGPPGSCSPVRPLGVLCCVCGVLGLPAPVHPCCPLQRTGGRVRGKRLTPDASHNGGRPAPPGTAPPPPPWHEAPTGHEGQGDSVGPPHPHTRTHSTWVADPNSPPSGRAVGGGTVPDLRRPSHRWKAPRPGTPFRHPHSEHCRPTRPHAVGLVLGPHACTERSRDTRFAEPWLPAPEDGRPGKGQRLTPDAPHNGGRHPPRRRPSATPTASNAGPQGRTLWGRCWVPGPAPTAPRTHRSQNLGRPPQRAGGWERDSA